MTSHMRAFCAATLTSLALLACADNHQTPPTPGSVLFTHVRIPDLTDPSGKTLLDASILVEGDRITAVETGDGAARLEAQRTIDATGMTALPGLYDMHVHLWDEPELAAYLSYGVTTVRNMSGMPFHLEWAEQIKAGERTGPRLLTTGPILNSHGPNEQINHQIVETADEARAAVRQQKDWGYKDLKVYSNLTREAYDAILDEASTLGLTISGHPPEGRRDPGIPQERPFNIAFEEILDDGFLTLEHSESIVWHGLYDSHDPEPARVLARSIAASGTAVTPTLLAYHNLLRVAETSGEAARRPEVELLNPVIMQQEQAGVEFWAQQPADAMTIHDRFLGSFTQMMQEEGVLLVAGSDAGIFINIPGLSLLEEIQLLARAGLTPLEALQTASYNPALLLDEADQRGQIARGYIADLVLYACDPLTDLTCLEKPAGVMAQCVWHDAARLEALKAIARQHDADRTMSLVFPALEAQGVDLSVLAQ